MMSAGGSVSAGKCTVGTCLMFTSAVSASLGPPTSDAGERLQARAARHQSMETWTRVPGRFFHELYDTSRANDEPGLIPRDALPQPSASATVNHLWPNIRGR